MLTCIGMFFCVFYLHRNFTLIMHICVEVYVDVYGCTYVCVCGFVCVCAFLSLSLCVNAYMLMCVCLYVCVLCECMYV